MFAGHEHSYERTVPIGGVTYVITGGGGRAVRPVGTSAFTAKSQAALHVTHVEVRGTSMVVRALDVAGTTIDSFELTIPDYASRPKSAWAAGAKQRRSCGRRA